MLLVCVCVCMKSVCGARRLFFFFFFPCLDFIFPPRIHQLVNFISLLLIIIIFLLTSSNYLKNVQREVSLPVIN